MQCVLGSLEPPSLVERWSCLPSIHPSPSASCRCCNLLFFFPPNLVNVRSHKRDFCGATCILTLPVASVSVCISCCRGCLLVPVLVYVLVCLLVSELFMCLFDVPTANPPLWIKQQGRWRMVGLKQRKTGKTNPLDLAAGFLEIPPWWHLGGLVQSRRRRRGVLCLPETVHRSPARGGAGVRPFLGWYSFAWCIPFRHPPPTPRRHAQVHCARTHEREKRSHRHGCRLGGGPCIPSDARQASNRAKRPRHGCSLFPPTFPLLRRSPPPFYIE